jgi:iron(III) transport system ATP-binding protein
MSDPSDLRPAPALAIDDLRVRLGTNEILRGVSYAVRPGRIAALLGRSGSGKTTLLRCVAGLETPTEGSIAIGETPVFDAARGIDVPTERRNLGLVFQSYALWPHKTVFDNVAYGLRVRGAARAEIEARVAEVLQGVGLGALGARFPHQLSGGQQQRVALARAFAYGPPVILLDEPLSNLDAKLREESRIWVRSLIKRLGLTALFVTHDQVEAMAIADEIVLIEEGRIVQAGTPQQLYDEPATLFVAEFMGSNTVLHGRIAERRAADACLEFGGLRLWGRDRSAAPVGETATAVIRLDRVAVLDRAGDNRLAGELESSVFLGERWESLFAVAGQPVRVFHQAPLAPAQRWVHLPPEAVWVF